MEYRFFVGKCDARAERLYLNMLLCMNSNMHVICVLPVSECQGSVVGGIKVLTWVMSRC